MKTKPKLNSKQREKLEKVSRILKEIDRRWRPFINMRFEAKFAWGIPIESWEDRLDFACFNLGYAESTRQLLYRYLLNCDSGEFIGWIKNNG